MKHFIKQIMIAGGLLIGSAAFAQTSYTNLDWIDQTAETEDAYFHTASYVNNGYLHVTSNAYNGNGDTDILTIKYDTNGDTLWMKKYGGDANADDYGVDIFVDNSGNVYVAGTVKNTSSDYDYCVLKYNSSGTLQWSYEWDGAGGGIDIPTDLEVKIGFPVSAIYVGGGTEGSGSSSGTSDFGIISLTTGGSFNWAQYYDYNGLNDGVLSVTATGPVLYMTGGSESTSGSWDVATVYLYPGTGQISSTSRTDTTVTMVEATAMTTDTLNNFYITGYSFDGNDKNIQTIKLDSNYTLQWIRDYDGGYDDEGNDIKIDNNGDIVVVGYSEVSSGKPKSFIIKYNSSGDTLWMNNFGDVINSDGLVSKKLDIDASDNIYITGTEFGSNDGYKFLMYNPSGDLKLTRNFKADTVDHDAFDILVNANEVYITGFTNTQNGTRLTTINYSLTESDTTIQYDSTSGDPMYEKHSLISRIDTSHILKSEIDNLNKEFWQLDEIFDSTAVSQIESKLSEPCNDPHCRLKVIRIFKKMVTTDTVATSRLNEDVRIPNFWAIFKLQFPEDVNVLEASDSLESLFPLVIYADPIPIPELTATANDTEYDNQSSLHNTTSYSNVHVNVEDAWDMETGDPFVRVGVFDSGIHYVHEDFDVNTVSGTKIAGGWNFENQSPLLSNQSGDANKHGTQVSGIIGALRNNSTGIAGIAGGNNSTSSLDSTGVSLYGMRIFNNYGTAYGVDLSYITTGIVESSIDDSNGDYRFGLHINNHSWGFSDQSIHWDTLNNLNAIKEAIEFSFKMGVTNVASRGNGGTTQKFYPATIHDDWVLNVSATGVDGEFLDGYMYGNGIDVAAPGSTLLVYTTSKSITNPNLKYSTFGGTSSAAPHVSGAAGLLMSYLNNPNNNNDPNNLAPEDIEQIIQMSATDTDTMGVDELTGYGRLNIGKALEQVDKNKFQLHHFSTDNTTHLYSVNQYSTGDTISLFENYQNASGQWFSPLDEYIVDTYKINANVYHSLSLTDSIVAYWPRASSSNVLPLFNSSNMLLSRDAINIDNFYNGYSVLSGYVYKVSTISGTPVGWWPFDTTETNFDFSYSVLRYDPTLEIEEEVNNKPQVKVFPNPTLEEQQFISISLDNNETVVIELLDLNGRIVSNIYNGELHEGRNEITANLDKLSKGVYLYKVLIGDKSHYLKTVKQ